jgi:putative effector of murein hydrolase LrgA (UPF0299 family)
MIDAIALLLIYQRIGEVVAQGLLQLLARFFIPTGTGVMRHFERMSDEWLPLPQGVCCGNSMRL